MKIYNVYQPKTERVPIIISSPHSGTLFPDDLKPKFQEGIIDHPDDTDWYIDRLYSFAQDLGILVIAANYHRWVIDLNRDPESKPLYDDGRVITSLTPTTDFNGDSLYKNGDEPSDEEIANRIKNYYNPYHNKLKMLTEHYRKEFGKVLLFDAHSIRDVVPGIRKEPFPQLILGDNDGKSCKGELVNTALSVLEKSPYELTHNHPFKGGYITRSIGNPKEGIHAMQLEMIKTNYMDDGQTEYDDLRAEKIRSTLKDLFVKLIETLKN